MLLLLEMSAAFKLATSFAIMLVLVPVLVVSAKWSKTLRVRTNCLSSCCAWSAIPSLRVVRRKRDTVPSLPMISKLSSSPGVATADEKEMKDTTINSVEAKEESRQRGGSMAVLPPGESADEKEKQACLCVAWGRQKPGGAR